MTAWEDATVTDAVIDNLLYGDGYFFTVQYDADGNPVSAQPVVPVREGPGGADR